MMKITVEDMRGGFQILKISDLEETIFMYGMYHGGTRGTIVANVDQEITTENIAEVYEALAKNYPNVTWFLNLEKSNNH